MKESVYLEVIPETHIHTCIPSYVYMNTNEWLCYLGMWLLLMMFLFLEPYTQ